MDLIITGKFIAELRKQQHLTQEQLGEIIGVTNKTVSKKRLISTEKNAFDGTGK